MKRKPPSPYPRLHRLFAAYVNQDWDAYGPKPEDAVLAYAKDATKAERAETVAEIERLLASTKTARAAAAERSLDAVLDELHCGYDPKAHRLTTAAWLDRVAGLLRATRAADRG